MARELFGIHKKIKYSIFTLILGLKGARGGVSRKISTPSDSWGQNTWEYLFSAPSSNFLFPTYLLGSSLSRKK